MTFIQQIIKFILKLKVKTYIVYWPTMYPPPLFGVRSLAVADPNLNLIGTIIKTDNAKLTVLRSEFCKAIL